MAGYYATTQIVVNGTLTATGSTFYISGGNYGSFTLLQVNSGGELIATGTHLQHQPAQPGQRQRLNSRRPDQRHLQPAHLRAVPDIALLANNQSFQDINIIAGTLTSGQTLTLNPIGTASTANLVYVFPGNFTVAPERR